MKRSFNVSMHRIVILRLVDTIIVIKKQFTENFMISRGYSSVVEHSTADREVPGSNPGAPYQLFFVGDISQAYQSGRI